MLQLTTTLDAPDAVREMLDGLEGLDADARELVCKMAMRLHLAEGGGDESRALLPGALCQGSW